MPQPTTPSRALVAPAALMAAILVGATAVACGSDSTTTPGPSTWVATMNGAAEFPPKTVTGTGSATIVKTATGYTYTITYQGMTGNLTGGHIHGPAPTGANAAVIVPFANATGAANAGTLAGTFASTNTTAISNDSLEVLMTNGNAYVNLHTQANGGGEIRGQLVKQQ
jgi:Cu/Zn superoxide dismutase